MPVLATRAFRSPDTPLADPAVDALEFKEVLARLASGLAIVSCWRDGRAEGILISSITGLSLEPPRFLFCVRREASVHDALEPGGICGVSILSGENEMAARAFIEPDRRTERFADAAWRLNQSEPPLLQTALASATCRIDSVIDANGHSIVVVSAQSLERTLGDPLLAYNRNLHRLPTMDA